MVRERPGHSYIPWDHQRPRLGNARPRRDLDDRAHGSAARARTHLAEPLTQERVGLLSLGGEQRELLTLLLFFALLKCLAVLFILKWRPLRMLLTPGSTKTRRVRRRAIMLFKAGAERRTIGRTGILIYLSMAEHRAEIVGDEAITKVTTPETWGEAMAALLTDVKQGRPADGIVAAVGIIGEVLAQHFPKSGEDTNEIPDKLIEL